MKSYIQWSNGSGKTHILDAIHIVSWANPLYGNVSLDDGTIFEAHYTKEAWLTQKYSFSRQGARDIYMVQSTKVTKQKYIRDLPWRTVYISPFDMNLLYFAPGMRRDAIDSVLSRAYDQFSKTKKEYDSVMRQRNALLKKIRDGETWSSDLDFWDSKFALIAEQYMLYRKKYCTFIATQTPELPAFFGSYSLRFDYISSIDRQRDVRGLDLTDAQIIKKYLFDNRQRDILIGHTHIGPHRDDWGFVLESNIPAQEYLSRGEMKMILLGLKIIEANFLSCILGRPTILLVDDIFAELDEKNSDIFLSVIKTHQVILTSQKALPNHEKHHDFICINLDYT